MVSSGAYSSLRGQATLTIPRKEICTKGLTGQNVVDTMRSDWLASQSPANVCGDNGGAPIVEDGGATVAHDLRESITCEPTRGGGLTTRPCFEANSPAGARRASVANRPSNLATKRGNPDARTVLALSSV